ncbi:MAG: DUF1972 domain-containing protein [Chitinophagaceae bacterium]|nr:MAG: DUF1972 domain-containing protein [Chitinophagaceae bacterium]
MKSSLLHTETRRVSGKGAGLRIAILGTRGIPNRYGGFEQISETLAAGLVQRGHEVTVYCSALHPDKSSYWHGVRRILCADPEDRLGTFGQFLYDRNCLKHARNMDGLEWKRSKYSAPVRRFLRSAEAWAVRYSHSHIADSPVIKSYLDDQYGINARFIPYGANVQHHRSADALLPYQLAPYSYFMLMARMEPENHVLEILDGYMQSSSEKPMIVVGNTANRYGQKLLQRFHSAPGIHFLGGIFNQEVVHQLRGQASLYFHGHSVGGTNPSLLEAMASGALIAAHRNPFNEAVLAKDAYYFSHPSEVAHLILQLQGTDEERRTSVQQKIAAQFNWERVIDQYEQIIHETCTARP